MLAQRTLHTHGVMHGDPKEHHIIVDTTPKIQPIGIDTSHNCLKRGLIRNSKTALINLFNPHCRQFNSLQSGEAYVCIGRRL